MSDNETGSINIEVETNLGLVIGSINNSTVHNTINNVIDEQFLRKLQHRDSDLNERTHLLPCEQCAYHFTRPEYVSKICDGIEASTGSNQRYVLWGLSGAGKSQIAFEIAKHFLDTRTVYWMRADSVATFTADCEIISKKDAAKTSASNAAGDVISRALRIWDTHETTSLVILDNADDLSIFREADDEGIRLMDFLPRACPCVITTRDRRFAGEYATMDKSLEVTLLPKSIAFDLFSRSIPRGWLDTDSEESVREAYQLLEDLGHLPLAIAQAATNIREGFLSSSISRYRASYLRHAKTALKHPVRPIGGISQSILSTWDISLQILKRKNQQAVEILNHLVFFDRSNLLEGMIAANSCFQDMTEQQISEAVSTIVNLGFLSVPAAGFLEMHTSVQLWGLQRLNEAQWRRYLLPNITILVRALSTVSTYNQSLCDWAFNHGIALVDNANSVKLKTPLLSLLTNRLGMVCGLHGKWTLGQRLCEQSFNMASEVSDSDPDLLQTLRTEFLTILRGQGRHKEALEESRELLKDSLARNGQVAQDHNQSIIVNEMMQCLDRRSPENDVRLVESCLQEILASASSDPGSAQMALATHNLAFLYKGQGRFDEASLYSRETLDWIARQGAQDDPRWQGAFQVAGVIMLHQGRAAEAFDNFLHLLENSRRHHEPHDVNVLVALLDLVRVAFDLQRWSVIDKVMASYLDDVEIADIEGYSAEKLGIVLNDWGVSLQRRGRLKDAIFAHNAALELYQAMLTPDNGATSILLDSNSGLPMDSRKHTFATALYNLVLALLKNGDDEKALWWKQRYPNYIESAEMLHKPLEGKLKEYMSLRGIWEQASARVPSDTQRTDSWWTENADMISRAEDIFGRLNESDSQG